MVNELDPAIIECVRAAIEDEIGREGLQLSSEPLAATHGQSYALNTSPTSPQLPAMAGSAARFLIGVIRSGAAGRVVHCSPPDRVAVAGGHAHLVAEIVQDAAGLLCIDVWRMGHDAPAPFFLFASWAYSDPA